MLIGHTSLEIKATVSSLINRNTNKVLLILEGPTASVKNLKIGTVPGLSGLLRQSQKPRLLQLRNKLHGVGTLGLWTIPTSRDCPRLLGL